MKRLLDVALASIALILFLPLGAVIAVILRFTGEGEVFYPQVRIGKDGKEFELLKFATMLKRSPSIGSRNITLKDDPRVLPAGKWLRRTKLNEVPQLWNILVGDMSIVGPRPLTRDHYEFIPECFRKEIRVLQPGLTGIGSIIFRDEEEYIAAHPDDFRQFYRDQIAPFKGQLELWYLQKRSFCLDLALVFLTGWIVVFPSSKLPQRVFRDLPKHELFNK